MPIFDSKREYRRYGNFSTPQHQLQVPTHCILPLKSVTVSISNQSPMDLHTPDIYIPFFTILEFISYFGWIKVAETLLNPFGDDDEDFQINYLIDRNFQACSIHLPLTGTTVFFPQVSYLIVDEAMHDLDMAPDPFLNHGGEIPPSELPYR